MFKLKNCLNCKKYIQKIQEFTPGDIPDNSPVQWHRAASPVATTTTTTTTSHYYCYCIQLPQVQVQCFSPKANNARPILRSLLSTIAALPYTAFLYSSSVAGQVDVLHNGRGSGTNHKKRERRHFWPNCQILKLLLPTNYF